MKGTFIITGANGGLGANLVSHFLKSLYAKDYKGIFAVRNPASAETLKKILAGSSSAKDHEIITVDLSTLASVRNAAKDFNQRVASGSIPRIRALVLNAAIQHTQGMKSTEDGLEANFAINYLSNFLFTNLLLQSMDPATGRVVIVSSWTHDPSYYMNSNFITNERHKTVIPEGGPQALAKPPGKDTEGDEYKAGMRRYGMSKTLMVMFMYELQRRLAGTKYSDVSVVAVDPGAMGGTGLFKESPATLRFVLHGVMAPLGVVTTALSPNGNIRTPSKSAKDLLNASFDEGTLGKHPKAVYLNGSARFEPSKETRDETKQKQLWMESVKLSGLREDEAVLGVSL